AFSYQNSHNTWRPDHPSRMKLYEFHVDEFRTGFVCERVPISGIFPAVACDFVGAPNAAGGQDDRFSTVNFEAPPLALIPEGANHAVSVFEQRKNGVLHVHVDSLRSEERRVGREWGGWGWVG